MLGDRFQTPGSASEAISSPTPTSTLQPTPTATPIPAVRLDEGDWALFNGDWDRALDAYQSVLDSGSSTDEAALAQLGIGTTLVRAQRYTEALQVLSVYLDSYPDHPRRSEGYFLRARVYEALDDPLSALQDYDHYLQYRPGIIDSYVQERAGDILRSVGNPVEAILRFQAAVEAPRLGGTLGVLIKIGRARLEDGQYELALEAFDQVYAYSSAGTTKATVNLLAGQALEAVGDLDGAYERYLDSVYNYPNAYDTYIGLIALVDAEVPVDEFQRGLVDYYAGATQPALNAFNRYLSGTETAAGYYYRGLTLLALGDPSNALLDFQYLIDNFPGEALVPEAWLQIAQIQWPYQNDLAASLQTHLDFLTTFPDHVRAPELLFDAGRLAERMGDLAQAATIWLRIANEYPASSYAYWGSWESGFVRYRRGDFAAALSSFQQANAFASDSAKLAATQLWVGKCHQAQGDQEAAHTAWGLAAAADPTGYYSVRAQDLLDGNEPFESFGVFDFSTDIEAERQEAEAWLRQTFSIETTESLFDLDAALASDPRLIRGEEFWRLGLFNEARAEFEDLRSSVQNDPVATFRLVHKFLDLGLYRSAIHGARQILHLAGMDDAATMNAPPYFNHIRFGHYFGELILLEAFHQDLDGLLLFSVVRLESAFEGFVTSYAAARGLMQVIPSTGQSIAAQLGWPDNYTDDDLYRPFVSVRFGAYYLAQQRDRFDGDLFAALAAYNAGPGNAAIWKEMVPDDPDLFLEVIRLNQPHLYIRRIYETYTIYRQLYTVLD
ncbi:MAG TPA: tetratricopeptide repeat protein [Anaerolineae bacterium]|nr:tetratricopeptide repeat protein [Anaerolineae bacterium]